MKRLLISLWICTTTFAPAAHAQPEDKDASGIAFVASLVAATERCERHDPRHAKDFRRVVNELRRMDTENFQRLTKHASYPAALRTARDDVNKASEAEVTKSCLDMRGGR
ncbi:MAG: hypothetical protein RLZZ618_172 [Pseudomonadota bacterium]|jgi:hypothetical protein